MRDGRGKLAASRAGRERRESARDRSAVVLLALPPEAAIFPAAKRRRAVRNREVFGVAAFVIVFDFRLAASGEIGVRAELDPVCVLPIFHEEF